ncbi:hypothetical protein OVA29_10605 [Exiguobacterium sp. SL14]|nr:hypothetical protein [Exiguobacterium sp. SL14]MCY1691068.1 hypothetical protein [Exiguobacterium sp. SL14]
MEPTFQIDCTKCFGLCCTALAFSKSSDFGHDKPKQHRVVILTRITAVASMTGYAIAATKAVPSMIVSVPDSICHSGHSKAMMHLSDAKRSMLPSRRWFICLK